jgi:hypothetical protein
MCQPDLTVWTLDWMPGNPDPVSNHVVDHECVDWNHLEDWVYQRSFSLHENLIRRPDGKSTYAINGESPLTFQRDRMAMGRSDRIKVQKSSLRQCCREMPPIPATTLQPVLQLETTDRGHWQPNVKPYVECTLVLAALVGCCKATNFQQHNHEH